MVSIPIGVEDCHHTTRYCAHWCAFEDAFLSVGKAMSIAHYSKIKTNHSS